MKLTNSLSKETPVSRLISRQHYEDGFRKVTVRLSLETGEIIDRFLDSGYNRKEDVLNTAIALLDKQQETGNLIKELTDKITDIMAENERLQAKIISLQAQLESYTTPQSEDTLESFVSQLVDNIDFARMEETVEID